MQTRRWPANAGSRLKPDAVLGRPHPKGQPSSRTGENSPYGMSVETLVISKRLQTKRAHFRHCGENGICRALKISQRLLWADDPEFRFGTTEQDRRTARSL